MAEHPTALARSLAATERDRASDAPVSTLRGASVGADVRRISQVLAVVVMAGLAVAAVVLFVAGARKNSQITRLQHQGTAVTVTVTGCEGQLGGSGTNAASYSCRGSFALGDHRYVEAIPGSAFHRPGTTLRAVAVPGDPSLVAPASQVESSRASWKVYLLPAILAAADLALIGLLASRRRSNAVRGSAQVGGV